MTSDAMDTEPWESVIATDPPRKRHLLATAIGYLLLAAGLAVFLIVMIGLFKTTLPGDEASRDLVDSWPKNDPKGIVMRMDADGYNARLKASGQPVIGESTGPDADKVGHSERTDRDYNATLDMGGGIMGQVVIPRIGVDIIIRHGSSNEILNLGAGHVYGTSMPVGGKGTHAVIAAHRGAADRMMFLRLDEMKRGDAFYIKTLGHTLGYRVTDIRVVNPDEVSSLRIKGDEDQVTLLTCTPFNVNTQRLLVTGTRADIPDDLPAPGKVRGDPVAAAIIITAIVAVTLSVAVIAVNGARQQVGGCHIAGQGRRTVGKHGRVG